MAIGRAALAAALLTALATPASAQRRADIGCDSPDDIEVRELSFVGNKAHTSYSLERGIETTASTWWRRTFRVFGQKYCLDSIAALVTDSARLDFHYVKTGFPDVRIKPVLTSLGPKLVKVEYRITEGRPMLMDSVTVVWVGAPPDSLDFTRDLPVEAGDRFDTALLEAGRDTIRRRLLNRGYPEALVLRNFFTRPSAYRASVQYEIHPGPKSWIGKIVIPPPTPLPPNRTARINTDQIRAALGVKEGDLYNESALERAERGLFDTEAFRFVGVTTDSTTTNDGDSLVTIDVQLVESTLSATRASVGWATLDCLRAQVNHTRYNFLGLRRLDVNARVSKVGTSYPTEWAEGFCSSTLLNDEVSDTLNYYLGGQISQAALFGLRIVPTLLVYTERRSEFKAYLRDTKVGVIASAQQGLGGQLPLTWSYQLEYGKTSAQPAFFCAVFNVCEAEARERLERYTRSAVLGWAATRTRAFPNVVNPVTGSVMRLELRHASPLVGATKDASFNRATFDASWYQRALGGIFVTRLRAGAVLGTRLGLGASAPTFIPLTERLYAGGPNSVRGFRQNEMGPAIYVPDTASRVPVNASDSSVFYLRANPDSVGDRTVPSGGDNVVVANVELRMRSPAYPELVQYALFLDAGQVWNRGRAGTGVNFADIQFTPGIGLRVFTPIGPIRMDVGYNPYRRTAGPAYITDPSGNLLCVSPGNTLQVRIVNGLPEQESGDCPATYVPHFGRKFWNRLTFAFSIGQPF